jgi:hypothetical protein
MFYKDRHTAMSITFEKMDMVCYANFEYLEANQKRCLMQVVKNTVFKWFTD